MDNTTPTAIRGCLAGHWTHPSGTTGVTAFLFPEGAAGAVHVPGHAPGTRELAALRTLHVTDRIHGICLAGGSAYGLAAADGVMRALEERGVGFDTGHGLVPIVPAAILFDLDGGTVRPDTDSGYLAAQEASDEPLKEGRVGAGAGARIGRLTGNQVPGGLACSAQRAGDYLVGVAVAVNASGSIRDPNSGEWLTQPPEPVVSDRRQGEWTNTTLGVIVTDAPVHRNGLELIARMASAGFARTLWPAFSPFDGDVIFAVSTPKGGRVDNATLSQLGHAAALNLERSVLKAGRVANVDQDDR